MKQNDQKNETNSIWLIVIFWTSKKSIQFVVFCMESGNRNQQNNEGQSA